MLLGRLAAVHQEPERPPFWRGYRVLAERFEFWIADENYVHDRFEYLRGSEGLAAAAAALAAPSVGRVALCVALLRQSGGPAAAISRNHADAGDGTRTR